MIESLSFKNAIPNLNISYKGTAQALKRADQNSDVFIKSENTRAQKEFLDSKLCSDLLLSAKKSGIKEMNEFKAIASLLNIAEKNAEVIGQGSENVVIKIPNSSYVVRHPKDKKYLFSEAKFDYKSELSEYYSANHILAHLSNDKKYSIMPHLEGLKDKDFYNKEYGKVVSNMPQSSYNGFLRDIKNALEANLAQDTGAPNVIVDAKTSKMTPIDYRDFWNGLYSDYGTYAMFNYEKGCIAQIDPINTMSSAFITHTMNDGQKQRVLGKIIKAVALDKDDAGYCFINSESKNHPIKIYIKDEKLASNIMSYLIKIQDLKYKDANPAMIDKMVSKYCELIDRHLLANTEDAAKDEIVKIQDKIIESH